MVCRFLEVFGNVGCRAWRPGRRRLQHSWVLTGDRERPRQRCGNQRLVDMLESRRKAGNGNTPSLSRPRTEFAADRVPGNVVAFFFACGKDSPSNNPEFSHFLFFPRDAAKTLARLFFFYLRASRRRPNTQRNRPLHDSTAAQASGRLRTIPKSKTK